MFTVPEIQFPANYGLSQTLRSDWYIILSFLVSWVDCTAEKFQRVLQYVGRTSAKTGAINAFSPRMEKSHSDRPRSADM